jgi:alkylmercury lyase
MIANDKVNVDAVTAHIVDALPKLDLFEQRTSLELYRLLALGHPVSRTLIAERLGVTLQKINQILDAWPAVFFDSQRQIVGYWGLSLPAAYDSPHKMTIDGRVLSAWCAWDTLFLPQLLGKKVTVESISPVNGDPVRLTVSPDGVEQLVPANAQMSFLLPDVRSAQKDLVSAFCCFVHFFPSRETGERWAAQHAGTFLVSIEEGMAIGQKRNLMQYRNVLPETEPNS